MTPLKLLFSFAITLGLALGLTALSDAQGPVVLRNSSGTEIATASTPVRVDPTGSTTQPVSGTVAVTQSGAWNITNVSGTVSLPTGAATETTLANVLTSANYAAAFGTAGVADAQVLTVQGVAAMTPLLTTTTLAAGAANIGDVDVLTVPADPFGVNADAASATGSISAKLRFIAATGIPITGTVTVGSHAVTNAGTFAVQVDGSALTALQLIDDAQTGDSVHYRTSAGTTEDETEIKGTAGRLFSVAVTNTNAAVRYFRCYNLTAANTTPGTSTVFLGLAIPGAATGAGFVHSFGTNGVAFSTALTCTLTTGAADTDVAEVAANEIKWTMGFK